MAPWILTKGAQRLAGALVLGICSGALMYDVGEGTKRVKKENEKKKK